MQDDASPFFTQFAHGFVRLHFSLGYVSYEVVISSSQVIDVI